LDILLEKCVSNGKAMRVKENKYPKVEIMSCADINRVTWKECRFYLSDGEKLSNRTKGLAFADCLIKPLGKACSTENLALTATTSATSAVSGHEAGKALDGNENTSWQAENGADQWLQLDFAQATTINEFRLREADTSSVTRYVIQCWDDPAAKWIGCFNGLAIGPDFIAPIASRTTSKVRLLIKKTTSGAPRIKEFAAYNDTTSGPSDQPPAGPPPTGAVNDSHPHVRYAAGGNPIPRLRRSAATNSAPTKMAHPANGCSRASGSP
jgi:hypothetical protein